MSPRYHGITIAVTRRSSPSSRFSAEVPRRAVKAMRAESTEAEDSATAVTWVASTSAAYAEIVTTRADSIATGGTAAAGFVVSISAAKAGGVQRAGRPSSHDSH